MAGVALTGEIKLIGAIENPSQNNPDFTKREVRLVIDKDGEYPQTISIEFIRDKCSLLNNFKVGDVVTIDVNIRGKETSDLARCFNTLNGWRIAGVNTAPAQPPAAAQTEPAEPADPDDLPF